MDQFLSAAELWLPGVIAMTVLVLGSGFFSSSETAMFSLSRDEVRRFRLGKSRERIVAGLLRNPDRVLTAVLFWNLVINLSYFAVSVVISQRLISADQKFAAGGVVVVALVGMIICGEVLPKSIAVVFPKVISLWFCYPLAIALRLVDPISPALNKISRLARRTFWPHVKKEPYLDADDLERAIDVSHLDENVVRHERQVLHNILDLSEVLVEEVMRPRGSYLTVAPNFEMSHLGHEVPPGDCVLIAEDDVENIGGMLPLVQVAHLPEADLLRKTEPVIYVPWTANLAFTLQQMTRKYSHVASVVNEYGENIGIVTYDDIMDSILSAEPSRARRVLKREPVLEVAPGKYHVEGMTTLRYLSRRLNLDYEPDSDGLITVAGMMHDQLERMPSNDDECEWQGFRFRVFDASRRGRLRVMVFQNETATTDGEETG